MRTHHCFLVFIVLLRVTCLEAIAQCPADIDIVKEVVDIEKNNSYDATDKLGRFTELKNKLDACKSIHDTSKALVFLKLGKYEFIVNKTYSKALELTKKALLLNSNAANGGSHTIAVNIAFNIGLYYQRLFFYPRALAYYDTTLLFCRKYSDYDNYEIDVRRNKADIYFLTGDYQKAVEETILGMHRAVVTTDSSSYLYCLNRKAQSLCIQGQLEVAETNALAASQLAARLRDTFEMATASKTLGLVYERMGKLTTAEDYYKAAVRTRIYTRDDPIIASDYNDLGNFYLNSLQNYVAAKKCYGQTIAFAQKIQDSAARNLKIAMAYINLGAVATSENQWKLAEEYYVIAFTYLRLGGEPGLMYNPPAAALSGVINKDLVVALMSSKTSLLLEKFKSTRDKAMLEQCIATARVTDSMLTRIRFGHVSELSKLYWRDKTRAFYETALEAAWLKADAALGFYFMEKSKAVLLNDKINEINAAAQLPVSALNEEEHLQMETLDLQSKLTSVKTNSPEYEKRHTKLLLAEDAYMAFIKNLEQKYPAYFRSKYEDAVIPVSEVQAYLGRTGQSLIHCFVQDTSLFVLSIANNKISYKKLQVHLYEKMIRFLAMCSNPAALNANYQAFLLLSNEIYQTLFAPLQIPKGRVIISLDKIVIPFEALVSDVGKKHFLLGDYAFSYVYSFRTILHGNSGKNVDGNFLGVAPVSFTKQSQLPSLQKSADAIKAASSYYQSSRLLVNKDASKANFLDKVPGYKIVNIFSHASADSSMPEPFLALADSSIALSQLQLITEPATELVVLSACETNIGRNAVGEGIYSLARGFYMAGIPSVAATLWKADEDAIYRITERFNQNLARGMSKDVALQQAKLDYLQHADGEKLLPCYWANLIIVGNTEPVQLSRSYKWWWMAGIGIFSLLITGFFGIKYLQKKKEGR